MGDLRTGPLPYTALNQLADFANGIRSVAYRRVPRLLEALARGPSA
ncbi:MAG: hypothetical protein JOY63_04035 [Acetobacteraceae bacterium]|nr:hypothetical protein [Acetobacteraceae bacterium]